MVLKGETQTQTQILTKSLHYFDQRMNGWYLVSGKNQLIGFI